MGVAEVPFEVGGVQTAMALLPRSSLRAQIVMVRHNEDMDLTPGVLSKMSWARAWDRGRGEARGRGGMGRGGGRGTRGATMVNFGSIAEMVLRQNGVQIVEVVALNWRF